MGTMQALTEQKCKTHDWRYIVNQITFRVKKCRKCGTRETEIIHDW
jgi:hypothetical protein